ncbi:hypothetical protein PUG81_05065 [Erwiniaceae bacterium L1_54_6]|nr:hypothetical protein [Erwiniaceae bacterium L1_54_6]
MDKKYYWSSLLKGLFYYVIELAVWFWGSTFSPKQNLMFFVFATISLFLFPYAKFVLKEMAIAAFGEEFVTKWMFGNDIGTPKLTALLSLVCMILAIPLGLGCLIYQGLFRSKAPYN